MKTFFNTSGPFSPTFGSNPYGVRLKLGQAPAPDAQSLARAACVGLSDTGIPAEAKARAFWAAAGRSGVSPEEFVAAVKVACPNVVIPEIPSVEPRGRAGQGEIGQKTTVSLEEARDLLEALDEVLRPLTSPEAEAAMAEEACLRDVKAGNFPIVERLRSRLQAFVAANVEGSTFEISRGELNVTAKAVECAEAIGRGRVIRTAVTAGGIAAGGALLLLLL